jgi:hypothetical protein
MIKASFGIAPRRQDRRIGEFLPLELSHDTIVVQTDAAVPQLIHVPAPPRTDTFSRIHHDHTHNHHWTVCSTWKIL